ncbi:MAG: Gfo/Idh/MocA family oxidoreductase [Candidatus Pacebacteria bacterium]|nr:Gfo/Idh/MocA family oxidoreductase [Candidatus Paceibacterota bacterium]
MQKSSNKILVVGVGSIGQRHLKNLKTLGVDNLGIVEPNSKGLISAQLAEVKPLLIFSDLKTALKEKWNAVFVCSPSSTHLKIALEVAKIKTPMFIEKPLSHNLQNLLQLQKAIKNIKPVMVGYNIDFHPQFKKVQKIIKRKILGKILGVKAEFGYYLPDWREKTDYSKTYSAKRELGGGILLDDIHEINSVYNLFGPIKKVFGVTARVSNLKINTEDYVEAIVWFENGMIGQIHMDYLQRNYSRSLKIIGEKGSLIWDLNESKISLYTAFSKEWKVTDKIAKFDWNETYLEEVKEFLQCLQKKKNPESDFQRGFETLKIALAIKQSSVLNKTVNL